MGRSRRALAMDTDNLDQSEIGAPVNKKQRRLHGILQFPIASEPSRL